ncbi:MAG: hypothetical protein IJR89_02365 [Clostridia bacterium]|nr:hypothetical protein [Clostridia bacterium]
MKVLIAYAGVTGTTEECVRRLAAELSNLDVTVTDLAKETPELSSYDLVLVGGCVRRGKLYAPLRSFFEEQGRDLLDRPLGLFLVCGLAHEYEYYFERLLPKDLREHAFATLYFGGDLHPKQAGLWDKLYLYSMRSRLRESELSDFEYTPTLPGILPESIEKMAFLCKQALDAKK